MQITDIEVGLTDEEREIRDVTHRFAAEVMRPGGAELGRLANPEAVIAPESVLWKVFEQYQELGLNSLETGDGEVDPIVSARIRYLVNEALGWGDSGLAIGHPYTPISPEETTKPGSKAESSWPVARAASCFDSAVRVDAARTGDELREVRCGSSRHGVHPGRNPLGVDLRHHLVVAIRGASAARSESQGLLLSASPQRNSTR